MTYDAITVPLAGVEARPQGAHYGVFDHGAHVWAWQPAGQRPVLWVSASSTFVDGKAIRGGVPVIFPWFGPGRAPGMTPAHGLLRTRSWRRTSVTDTLDADGRLVVEHALGRDDIGETPVWPYAFEAQSRTTFTPEFVQIELKITNTDSRAFDFEEALHTYLAVGDVRTVTIEGLEGADYVDKTTGGTLRVQDGPVTFAGETDRVYASGSSVVLNDPAWQRRIKVSKEGSANTVVWNPWADKAAGMSDFGDDEWTGMVCIEAANALGDAVALEPGQTHVMRQRVTVL